MSGSVAGDEWHLGVDWWPVMSGICEKKNLFSYSVSLKSKKKKKNPPTLRVNLIQNQSLGISERESKRVLANLVVVVVIVLNWVFVALLCKRFDFLGDKKRL